MSLFSLIGIITLIILLVVGGILKIVLKVRREKLEGFHGFVESENDKKGNDDEESDEKEDISLKGWESL